MLKKFAPFETAQSWYFINPENQWKIEGKDLQDVAAKTRLYRAQNDFPELEFLESSIEHYLCGRPENKGKCTSAGPLKRGIIPTLKGGVVILKNIMYNSFVDQSVADERSAICKDCPLNIFPDKGPFVSWADHLAGHAVGDKKSKYHDELGNCDGCTCLMRSKVWAGTLDELKPEQEKVMRESNPRCWQLKENR